VKPGVNEDPRAVRDGAVPDWTTLGGYFEKLERQGISPNIASYVGHEQVWTYVKGYDHSPATRDEQVGDLFTLRRPARHRTGGAVARLGGSGAACQQRKAGQRRQ
jgi:N-acyl-D-aspartate/D-glutamate deacylase